MSSQAGYGSRLQNNKALCIACSAYSLYNPSAADIQMVNYSPFVATVQTAFTPYAQAEADYEQVLSVVNTDFKLIDTRTREVRNAVAEIFSPNSDEYAHLNDIIDLITGDNERKNWYRRTHPAPAPVADPVGVGVAPSPLPTPQPAPWQSVSQQDRGSILIHFTELIDELGNYAGYVPNELDIQVAALSTVRDDAQNALNKLVVARVAMTNQLAIIIPMFEGAGSLSDRATRAKLHVKRVYGVNSLEFKALTGKIY